MIKPRKKLLRIGDVLLTHVKETLRAQSYALLYRKLGCDVTYICQSAHVYVVENHEQYCIPINVPIAKKMGGICKGVGTMYNFFLTQN